PHLTTPRFTRTARVIALLIWEARTARSSMGKGSPLTLRADFMLAIRSASAILLSHMRRNILPRGEVLLMQQYRLVLYLQMLKLLPTQAFWVPLLHNHGAQMLLLSNHLRTRRHKYQSEYLLKHLLVRLL